EPRHGFARAHIGPPDPLGHPLARSPGAGGVARGQTRQRTGGEVGVSGDEEGLCRAVGHREWAGGDARRGLEEVDERKLMEAREGAVPPFVWKGDEALLGRDPERLLPEARQLDPVDAASPRVPRGQDGDRRLVLPEKLVERPAREGPHLPERRLDLPEDLGREVVFEEGAENGVALVRVAKGRGSLDEGHGVAHVIPLFNDIAFTLSESRPPRASAVPP